LANIVLHELDRVWEERCGHLGVLVRYADDLVILCRSETAAQESKRRLGIVLERLRLRMNPNKTRVVNLLNGQDGFDFLGFHHRVKESWRRPGHWNLHKWPSTRAMQAVRQKIREVLSPRAVLSMALEERIWVVNPVLRGWGQYFRIGTSTLAFQKVDRYVTLRFAIFLREKHQWRALGLSGSRVHRQLATAGLYRLTGTVSYSRVVNARR